MAIKHAIAAGAAVITALGITTAAAVPATAATTAITCTTGLYTEQGAGILLASGCRPAQGGDAPYTFQIQKELGTQTPRTVVCQTANRLTPEEFDQGISLLYFVFGPILVVRAPELRAAGPDYWGGGQQCTSQPG